MSPQVCCFSCPWERTKGDSAGSLASIPEQCQSPGSCRLGRDGAGNPKQARQCRLSAHRVVNLDE